MNFAVVLLLVVAVSFLETSVDATICQPLSKFKIDCDECQCSEDGREYSCTMRNCGPFGILKSKDVLGRKKTHVHSRDIKEEIPYIKDEIPRKGEDIQNEFQEDLIYNDISSMENMRDEDPIEDVDLSEQNASFVDDESSENFRRKRNVRKHRAHNIDPRTVKKHKRYLKPRSI